MRVQTMAWFYGASGQLIHMGYLQFDHKTPNRLPGPNFGATDIDRFAYELKREKRIYEETIIIDSKDHGYHEFKVPYAEDVVKGHVTIGMNVNYFITELLAYLTRGQALSKIVVREDRIDESGRSIPFMQYTYKDCWLFEHETKAEFDAPQTLDIKFTYCCAEIHCFDGNRFATHERCIPSEPEENIQYQENYAHTDAIKQQAAIEAKRLAPTPVVQNDGAPVIHRFDVRAASEFNGGTVTKGALDEIAFHIVEEAQSTDSLIDLLFENPNESTRSHFRAVNKHLMGGVTPGQMVFLTPAESKFYQTHADFLLKEAYKVDEILALKAENRAELAKGYTAFGNFAGLASNGTGYTTTFFANQKNQILQVLKEIEDGYSTKHRLPGGTLKETQFLAERARKIKQIESLLKRLDLFDSANAHSIPWLTRQMDLSRKSVERTWRNFGTRIIPKFSEHYLNADKLKTLLKSGNTIALGLGAFSVHTRILQACLVGDQNVCAENRMTEWAGFSGQIAGNIAGGAMGAAGAQMVLRIGSAALGVSTGGLGGLIVVGIASIAGSYLAGEKGKGMMQDFSETEYDNIQKNGDRIDPLHQLQGRPYLLVVPF